MSESSTAEQLPIVVRIRDREFLWTPDNGLDMAAVHELRAFICQRAIRLERIANLRGLDLDDLIQQGFQGALQATQRYDPAFGCAFLTFAEYHIRHAQLSVLKEGAVHISSREHEAMRKAGQVVTICSLDVPIAESETTLGALLRSEYAAPDELAQLSRVRERVWVALRQLERRLREAIIRRHGLQGEPETLAEIGRSWGVSRERVRQIQALAEARLKRILLSGGPGCALHPRSPHARSGKALDSFLESDHPGSGNKGINHGAGLR